jgi:hypothetical protein
MRAIACCDSLLALFDDQFPGDGVDSRSVLAPRLTRQESSVERWVDDKKLCRLANPEGSSPCSGRESDQSRSERSARAIPVDS